MEAQGVANNVPNFVGNNLKNLKIGLNSVLIKCIEKFATLTNVSSKRIKLVAYQSCKGPVSDFLKRHLAQHADHN